MSKKQHKEKLLEEVEEKLAFKNKRLKDLKDRYDENVAEVKKDVDILNVRKEAYNKLKP